MSPLFTATLRSRYCPFGTTSAASVCKASDPGPSFVPPPEYEELQIPALGKGQTDRMVGRRTPLLEQRQIGARLDGRFANGGEELFRRHTSRAARGGEDPARPQH